VVVMPGSVDVVVGSTDDDGSTVAVVVVKAGGV